MDLQATNGEHVTAPADAVQEEHDALQLTLLEQTEHLDALTARLEFMSYREAELRAMLIDAHEQLVERDHEIQRLRASHDHMHAQMAEVIAWAHRAVGDVTERDAIIGDLQATLHEQTAWAQHAAGEVVQRDAIITSLQARCNDTQARLDAVQARLDDVEARFQRLQHMLPARLYRRARRLLPAFKR
jgi:hypothetical protein